MNGREEANLVSRRRVISLLALAVAGGFGALTASDAEAQTAGTTQATGTHGMQRRQGRRSGRHERRHTRRTGHATSATPPAK